MNSYFSIEQQARCLAVISGELPESVLLDEDIKWLKMLAFFIIKRKV